MNSRTLLSKRITDRFITTTGHVTEYDVQAYSAEAQPEYPDLHWTLTDPLDAGLAISLRSRVQPVDFSEDTF